jgi:trans-aconitate methyltransferase
VTGGPDLVARPVACESVSDPEAIAQTAAQISSQWNADLYDTKHAFVWKRGAGLLSLLQPSKGETILDLGCGSGHLTSQIAASGAHVVGVDSSPEMIEEARKNYPSLRFVLADARDFDFNELFDAIFSNAALHWVKEADRVIDRVWNALKPRGRFVAEFGGKGNVQKLLAAFYESLEKIGTASADRSNPWYFPSMAEYTALLEKQGFDVTFASLFDRPTALDDGDRGLRNWISMFGRAYCSGLSEAEQEQFIRQSEKLLRPVLFHDGSWFVDYRRLRIVAHKP